jgi:basic membrane protein A
MKKVKWFVSLMLVLAMTFSIVGCAGEEEPAVEEPAVEEPAVEEPAEEALKVALLLDGNINDGGWNQLPYEGLLKAESELGIEGDYTELIPQNEVATVMRDYANKGYDIIIANGYSFTDALNEISEEYPEVMFVGMNIPKAGPNLSTARIEYGTSGYLAALATAKMTKTNKVGIISAVESPQMQADLDNMLRAYEELGTGIEIKSVYTGDWADVNKAKQGAVTLADEGVDVIINRIDGATQAVADVAREKDATVIGWSGDEAPLDPDIIATSLVIRNDIVLLATVEKIMNEGYAPGESVQLGIETGAVGFGSFGNILSEEDVAELMSVQEDIMNGIIVLDTSVEGWD